MRIISLPDAFTICQVESENQLDLQKEFCFVGKTKEEISLVCKTRDVPEKTLRRDDEWRCFYLEGTLDFSLVGILAKIATLLANAQISIFALSTFNTDYVLVKSHQFQQALDLMKENGYSIA